MCVLHRVTVAHTHTHCSIINQSGSDLLEDKYKKDKLRRQRERKRTKYLMDDMGQKTELMEEEEERRKRKRRRGGPWWVDEGTIGSDLDVSVWTRDKPCG